MILLLHLADKTSSLVRKIRVQRAGLIHRLRRAQPSRQYFIHLIDALGLNGHAVEIGVAEGRFSESILKHSLISRLYSVDPWREFTSSDYIDRNNLSQREQDARYECVCARLHPFGERSLILRTTSLDAAIEFPVGSLDLVYIDANHAYDAICKDLTAWWPTVRVGGLFAGHDYLNGERPGYGTFGVRRAVDEFAARYRQHVFATNERWPSWYLVKR